VTDVNASALRQLAEFRGIERLLRANFPGRKLR
jgi:hypothetical protein